MKDKLISAWYDSKIYKLIKEVFIDTKSEKYIEFPKTKFKKNNNNKFQHETMWPNRSGETGQGSAQAR